MSWFDRVIHVSGDSACDDHALAQVLAHEPEPCRPFKRKCSGAHETGWTSAPPSARSWPTSGESG